MKKLILIAVIVFAGYAGINQYVAPINPANVDVLSQPSISNDAEFASAFKSRTSNLQIGGRATVVKLLADDNNGNRHQRFIVRLDSGQTLLVAHNIDLAPRLYSLREGDSVNFYGQYEWNEKGGVIHWTHADPNGSHVAGWIEHNGQKYQ